MNPHSPSTYWFLCYPLQPKIAGLNQHIEKPKLNKI
jgi:hypothetical protein